MTTLYDKRHYESISDLFKVAGVLGETSQWYVQRFADLFAVDNPRKCGRCWRKEGSTDPCYSLDKEHSFTDGFDRKQFLEACGLKSEG